MTFVVDDCSEGEPGACLVEVALPLRLSAKWVSYACRTAAVAKPKWSPIHEMWTSSLKAEDGVDESIAISAVGASAARVKVEWRSVDGAARDSHTARRIVSAVLTAMQWQVRRRVPGAADSQLHLR